jgi:serine/threonine protein kinase
MISFALVNVFRDLKPDNIYVTNNEQCLCIGDFGLVRELDSSLANTIAGTLRMFFYYDDNNGLGYMAPEIFTVKRYGDKADLWSLGCIFVEMMLLGLEKNLYIEILRNSNFHAELKQEIIDNGYSESLASIVSWHMINIDKYRFAIY